MADEKKNSSGATIPKAPFGRSHTGLRNRHRSGRSTYSVKRKGSQRDIYGTFQQGKQMSPDVIAGHVLSYKFKAAEGQKPSADS